MEGFHIEQTEASRQGTQNVPMWKDNRIHNVQPQSSRLPEMNYQNGAMQQSSVSGSSYGQMQQQSSMMSQPMYVPMMMQQQSPMMGQPAHVPMMQQSPMMGQPALVPMMQQQTHQTFQVYPMQYAAPFGFQAPVQTPVFPAYGYRQVTHSFESPGFQPSTAADFEATLSARNKEEKVQKLKRENERLKREKEEMSFYSVPRVSIESDSEAAESFPYLNKESPRKRKSKHDRKSKKHRRKHRRRNESCSSSGSASERSHRSMQDNRQNCSIPLKSDQPKREVQENRIQNMFDAGVNPWRLLRPIEYNYKTTHLVVDQKGDAENLKYDTSYKKSVAEHRSMFYALTNMRYDGYFLLNGSDNLAQTRMLRYYENHPTKNEKQQVAERWSVRKEFVMQPWPEFVSLDCVRNEQVDIKDSEFNGSSLDEYICYKKSKDLSFEEGDLNGKNIILRNRCNSKPGDVEAWIEFVRLQDQVMANDETGNPNAEVQNKDALYERKICIIDEALKSTGSNIRLKLEKLRVTSSFFGMGSKEVRGLHSDIKQTFIDSLRMWKVVLRSRDSIREKQFFASLEDYEVILQIGQNDRSGFDFLDLISFMDKCLKALKEIKDTLTDQVAIEEFLVSVIVHRCKLLVECGFVDMAVASVQSLAEFNFFCKETENATKDAGLASFEKFWMVGVPRIGDDCAKGWNKSDFTISSLESEKEVLDQQVLKASSTECALFEECRAKATPNIDIWYQLEAIRAEAYWSPVRHAQPFESIMFTSRFVSFDQVRPILFKFCNKKLGEHLVLELLEVFGATIPGVVSLTQQKILGKFSTSLFPSLSLCHDGIRKFLDNFFDLFLQAQGIDFGRILAAKCATFAKYKYISIESTAGKQSNIMAIMRPLAESNMSQPDQILRWLILAKASCSIDLEQNRRVLIDGGLRILANINRSIWKMSDVKERLVYLKVAKAVCRRLPSIVESVTENVNEISCKKELLIRLGINGNARPVENILNKEKTAKLSWLKILATSDANSPKATSFSWLADEDEIALELAATFCYELNASLDARLTTFNYVLDNSVLAKSLGDKEIVYKLKYRLYKRHIKLSSSLVSPKCIFDLLATAVQKFPESVSFMKKLLDLNGASKTSLFIQMNPGSGKVSRRIRACALIYLQWGRLANCFSNQALCSLRTLLEKTAMEQSESSDLDAYIWCMLLRLEQELGSCESPDEAFILAQKHCPWSKRLLIESARSKSCSPSHLTNIHKIMEKSGLQMFCQPDEIDLLKQPDYIEQE